MLLLDTHVILWVWENSVNIGETTKANIDSAWMDGSGVAVSSIVFWEIAHLLSRHRIVFEESLKAWRTEQVGSGILEFSIDGEIAMLSNELDWSHRDPADRFMVATAITHNFTLVTADARILEWDGIVQRLDART